MTNTARLLAVTFALLLAACSAPRLTHAEAAQVLPAATPEAAVRGAVEAQGSGYAGDCASTVSPRDIGRVCSRFVAEQGGTRAYLIGRTFSEFSAWVFVSQAGTGWVVDGTAPLDFAGGGEIPWP